MTWKIFDKRLDERLSTKIKSVVKDCEWKDAFWSCARPYIQWREQRVIAFWFAWQKFSEIC